MYVCTYPRTPLWRCSKYIYICVCVPECFPVLVSVPVSVSISIIQSPKHHRPPSSPLPHARCCSLGVSRRSSRSCRCTHTHVYTRTHTVTHTCYNQFVPGPRSTLSHSVTSMPCKWVFFVLKGASLRSDAGLGVSALQSVCICVRSC